MTENLFKIDKILTLEGARVIEHLNVGISVSSLEHFFVTTFPALSLPKDLVDVYTWHNGTTLSNDIPAEEFYLMPGFYLNSVFEVQRIFSHKIFAFEQRQLFPIFSS